MSKQSKSKVKTLTSKAELRTYLMQNGVIELPGINIQEPWCSMLLSGVKRIETRSYDCPLERRQKIIGAVATQRCSEPKSALVGLIRIVETKKYNSENEFKKDKKHHCVQPGSGYWFTREVDKWGWTIEIVAILSEPLVVKNRRGIVWSRSLSF